MSAWHEGPWYRCAKCLLAGAGFAAWLIVVAVLIARGLHS